MSGVGGASIAIRPDYPDPLWIQAVTLINAEIAAGVLKPGMRLPPERELCQQLGISRVTLRKALGQLVVDGVLNASHGRGWYVAERQAAGKEWPNNLESFTETATRMGLEATSVVIRAEEQPATFDEAEELSIAPGTPVFHLDRIRMLSGVAIAVDTTVFVVSLLPSIAQVDFTTESFYAQLASAGLEPQRAESTIEAREADEETSQHLTVAVGKPVLVMHQVAVGAGDRPLFASTIRYAGDRYRLRTHFARTNPAAR
jgi:GntR family transcriptional regulator